MLANTNEMQVIEAELFLGMFEKLKPTVQY